MPGRIFLRYCPLAAIMLMLLAFAVIPFDAPLLTALVAMPSQDIARHLHN